MLKRFQVNLQSGQTIIEILFATVVVATTMVAIASVMTFSIRNTAQSKSRQLATAYAQEAIEVYRRERVLLGWQRFSDALGSNTYCLNTLPTDSDAFQNLATGACTGSLTNGTSNFTRRAEITVNSASDIAVQIVVTWTDGNITKNVTVIQEFREYQ